MMSKPALRRFEAERLPEGNRIIERARHLGAYLQATQSAEERARSARHGIPEAVLAETAVLIFCTGEHSVQTGAGCSTRLCKNQVVTSSRKLAAAGLAARSLG